MKRERFYAIVDDLNKVLVCVGKVDLEVQVFSKKSVAYRRLAGALTFFKTLGERSKFDFYKGFSYKTWSTCRVAPVTIQEVLK